MKVYLQQSDRDKILEKFSDEQKIFLKEHVKRGKRTEFANQMAKEKGVVLSEHASDEEIEMLLDEWVLIDYIDNGYVSDEIQCECGRPLRYQYIVKHKKTNEIRKFGINHFEEHTGIPANIVKGIRKGFEKIDYELDDLLIKIKNKWELNEVITYIPNELQLPEDIQKHIDLNLPLLDRQVIRLRKIINEFMNQQPTVKQVENVYVDNQSYNKHQATFDLFSNSIETNHENVMKKQESSSWDRDSIPIEFEKYIKEYLMAGIKSARIMCEMLIKNHSAPKERFLTGKPKIYLAVFIYLDSLVEENLLEIKKEDRIDRIYSPINEFLFK